MRPGSSSPSQGVLFLNEKEFIKPVIDGLDKIRSQLEYKEVKIDPFAKMLEGVLGNAKAAQTAWPELAPLVNTFQLDQVALAYKALVTGGLPATKQVLTSVGNIAIATRSTMPVVAEAIVARQPRAISRNGPPLIPQKIQLGA
jgi:hypothetical protein